MTADIFEHLDALPPSAMKDEILKLVKTEGVVAAVRAAIDVLGDKKASAAARATMAALVFRLAGYLEKPDADDPFGIAKMSPAEIKAALPRWQREAEDAERNLATTRKKLAQLDAEDADIFA